MENKLMREQHPASFRFFIATLYFGVLMQLVLQGDVSADPLYIVASLGDELSPDEVRGNLQRGLPRDPQISCNEDGIRVEPMSSFHYNWLTTKLGQAPQVFGGRTLIEPDADSPDRWRLYLGDQNEDLERLEVFGTKDGQESSLDFQKALDLNEKRTDRIGGIGETQFDIYTRTPGVYSIKLPKGFSPERYKAHVRNQTKPIQSPEEVILADWPQPGMHCLITIPEFEGSVDRLKKTCKNPAYFENPINISDVVKSVRFLHANIGDVKPGDSVTIDGQTITLEFRKPDNREPKRVWIKFPLTRKQAEKEALRLEELGRSDPRNISADIRRSQHERSLPAPGKDYPDYKLGDHNGKWYEVPERRAGTPDESYKAAWEVQNAKFWADKGNRNWLVKVFEFQAPNNADDVASVRSIHPTNRRQANAIEQTIQSWNAFIEKLPSKK